MGRDFRARIHLQNYNLYGRICYKGYYFEKNKQLLVNDILDQFIYQMQNPDAKYPFYEQYNLEYEKNN